MFPYLFTNNKIIISDSTGNQERWLQFEELFFSNGSVQCFKTALTFIIYTMTLSVCRIVLVKWTLRGGTTFKSFHVIPPSFLQYLSIHKE